MKVSTSTYRYPGPHRLDVTRKSGERAFAPTWEMVQEYKAGRLSEEDYTRLYHQRLKESLRENPQAWESLLHREEVVLVCFCPAGAFCHRHLLKEIIRRVCIRQGIPFEDGGS